VTLRQWLGFAVVCFALAPVLLMMGAVLAFAAVEALAERTFREIFIDARRREVAWCFASAAGWLLLALWRAGVLHV
jgi:hypothetical protein